jgi:hypothetical protein
MTVWWVEFEGPKTSRNDLFQRKDGMTESQIQYIEQRERSGPRLATCSDDCTVRIWRRKPRERDENAPSNTGIPSIIRSAAIDEDWYQDAILPRVHERAIYSVSWSRETNLIASAGSDGKIIIYKERWREPTPNGVVTDEMQTSDEPQSLTEWVVIAELFSAHDVFEINHVTWAKRADKEKRFEGEEVIISTGDEGEVKVWTLDDVAAASKES